MTPLLVPATLDKATREAIQKLNPGVVFVVPGSSSEGSKSAAADAQTAAADEQYHRDVVNGWCDTIEDVLGYAGAAASLIVPGPVVPLVVKILSAGTEAIRSRLNKTPAVERWTLAMMEAEPAAVRPLS